jgi:hypothetical protein
MNRIFKYSLSIASEQTIEIPKGSKILHVDCQNNTPCLWALINDTNPTVLMTIRIVGTGHECPHAIEDYIGSVQQFNGSYVWHIFGREAL